MVFIYASDVVIICASKYRWESGVPPDQEPFVCIFHLICLIKTQLGRAEEVAAVFCVPHYRARLQMLSHPKVA